VSLPYAYSPQIWPSIIAIALLMMLTVYSIKNRSVPGAMPFAVACLFSILWMLGSSLEYAAVDFETKIFWRKFEVMWQLPSVTAIVFFLLEYAQPKRWLNQRNLILLSFIPLLTIFSIITNPIHGLFWEDFVFDGTLVAIRGPIAQSFLGYVYLLSFLNLIILTWLFIRSPQNRWPVVIIVVGQIFVRVFYFIDIYGRAPYNFSYTAVGITIGSLTYAFVLFRFRILGPMTLARQAVIEQIPMGMLVLDHQLKINSLNPVAERMLGVSRQHVKNRPISEVLDAYPQESLGVDQDYRYDFRYSTAVRVCTYQLDIIQLKDWRDHQVGQLLLLRDVTEQRKAQAKILEQGRVVATLQERDLLARELHDDLAQVLAFIDTQGQTVRRLLRRGDLEMVDDHMVRLVEAARGGEVDLRDSIQAMRLSLTEQGLVAKMAQHLAQFEQSFNIRTDLVTADSFDDSVLPVMVQVQVLRILQEALTNARKHSQANQVWVKFDRLDSSICVTVQDDGRGFELEQAHYVPDQHFGLQMMRERADAIGGKIEFSSQPGKGTKIMVCVPLEQGTVG
jgi:PAS domain S-box-containing protein